MTLSLQPLYLSHQALSPAWLPRQATLSVNSSIACLPLVAQSLATLYISLSDYETFWRASPPPRKDYTEWSFTGTIAGVAEGTVKVQAVLTYWTPGYPIPQIHVLGGPEHEVEVRGFVDLRFDNVGEWGEEDPGAFMGCGAIEGLTLRTCTAGNVTLSWNSDKIGLYMDSDCQNKVIEDDGSVEGSHRAIVAPTYPSPPDTDIWGANFRRRSVWAKGLEASTMVRDVHLTLSPNHDKSPPDLGAALFQWRIRGWGV